VVDVRDTWKNAAVQEKYSCRCRGRGSKRREEEETGEEGRKLLESTPTPTPARRSEEKFDLEASNQYGAQEGGGYHISAREGGKGRQES